jgi:hypothetical protein
MDQNKLKEAIAFARENGLKSIEVEGIRMELGDLPMELNVQGLPDVPQPEGPYDNLTDEEITYWGSDYFNELQVQKELRAKAKEETESTRE